MKSFLKKLMLLAIAGIVLLSVLSACGTSAPKQEQAPEQEREALPTQMPSPTIEPSPTAVPMPTQDPGAEPDSAHEADAEPDPAQDAVAEQTPAPEEAEEPNAGMDPELVAFLESYEAFIEEYVEFMKEYRENPTDLNLLMKYTSILGEYSEFTAAAEAYDTNEMTEAEALYYTEVMLRCSQKLLGAMG